MLGNRRFQVVLILILLTGCLSAQTISDSPYSRFGLGLMNQPGFIQNHAMGGVGIGFRDNKKINYLNPASYTSIDSMSFLFDFGIMGDYTNTETSLGNEPYYGAHLNHLAISFPITKWWAASIGILPYSKVGYSIKEEDYKNDIGFIHYIYQGNGGLSQLNLGTSFKIIKNLYLGANFKYLFGTIVYTRSVNFPLNDAWSQTEVETSTIIRDFILDLGIQYSYDFLEKYNITAGLIFDNKTDLSAEKTIEVTNTFPGNSTTINDSTYLFPQYNLIDTTLVGSIRIPTNMGIGLCFNYDDKIRFGIDYYRQDWSGSDFFNSIEPLTKSNSLHGGLEIIPNPQALKGYLNRVSYRLGGYYQNSYLQLKGERLKDYGISFGVGLPLRNTKSTFNLAYGLGRRGTLENDLIRESYMFLSFSLTLHDFWFMKRKFD